VLDIKLNDAIWRVPTVVGTWLYNPKRICGGRREGRRVRRLVCPKIRLR